MFHPYEVSKRKCIQVGTIRPGARTGIFLFILSALLTACAAQAAPSGSPRQIASYPANLSTGPGHPAYETARAGPSLITLNIETEDLEQSVRQAIDDGKNFGARVTVSQFWTDQDSSNAQLEFSVPANQALSLRDCLYRLGVVIDESQTGSRVDGYAAPYPVPNARIVLKLQQTEAGCCWNGRRAGGWNPLRTLRQASKVSTHIFRTLVDGLIWILVVAGPFALLLWVARSILRRLRSVSSAKE